MTDQFSEEFGFLPPELVFKTHQFVRAYHKHHGSGWLFVRTAHIRAAHSAYLSILERRIAAEGRIFWFLLGCILVSGAAAFFINVWLWVVCAIAIMAAFILLRRIEFGLVQERTLIIAMEILSIDFAGWGTVFPRARDAAREWLESVTFGIEDRMLDTYMPAASRRDFTDAFRPSEESIRRGEN
jgi:hypothetical protein